MTDSTQNVYYFDRYIVNVANREVFVQGHEIEVQHRVFDLLLYLIENRDRVVNKEELLKQVWGKRLTTEAALARAVMKARKAFGDDAHTQSVIRTIHGLGYRFVARLEPTRPETHHPEASLADRVNDETENQLLLQSTGPAPPFERSWFNLKNSQGKFRTRAFLALVLLLAGLVWFTGFFNSQPGPQSKDKLLAGAKIEILSVDPPTGTLLKISDILDGLTVTITVEQSFPFDLNGDWPTAESPLLTLHQVWQPPGNPQSFDTYILGYQQSTWIKRQVAMSEQLLPCLVEGKIRLVLMMATGLSVEEMDNVYVGGIPSEKEWSPIVLGEPAMIEYPVEPWDEDSLSEAIVCPIN